MPSYTYKYKLKFGGGGFVTNARYVIVQNGKTTSVVFNSIPMDMSLYGVSFCRKVYEPGHIQAELLVTIEASLNPTVDLMSSMLIQRPVILVVEKSHIEGDSTIVDDNFTIAENYYIQGISPQFEITKETRDVTSIDPKTGQEVTKPEEIELSNIYIKLDIFSLDKLMTFQKYSQAYLGQKLFGEILVNSKDRFVPQHGNPVEIEIQKLHHLGYQGKIMVEQPDKSFVEQDGQVELIHPYLVQYNETFYDFLRRTANRCGEVFYFEDGKLYLGIPDTSSVENISDASRIVFQRVASGSLSVTDYTRDTVKEWNSEKKSYEPADDTIMSDPIPVGDSGFPKDAFLTRSDGEVVYNSEVASEDHYMLLFRNYFARDSVTDLWCGADDDQIGQHVVSTIALVLKSTSLMEMLTNFALTETESAVKASIKAGKDTEEGNANLADEALDPQKDYAVLFSKVDDNKDHWITLNYTSDIKKGEQNQTGKMICVDMGTAFLPLKIGERITIPNDNKTYIVTQIDLTAGVAWQRGYDDPGSAKALRGIRQQQSQIIYAIPMDGSSFFPPLLPDQPFRRAGAQPAYVTDSRDPVGQGRIRIRYPWQPSVQVEKDNLDTAKDELSSAKDAYDIARKEFKQYAEIYVDVDCSDIADDSDLSDDELEALINERKKEVEDKTPPYDWLYKKLPDVDSDVYSTAEEVYAEKAEAYRTKKIAWLQAKAALMIAEAATPWIRMTSSMATSGGGVYFRPEVGDEVMVDYENGNIERPYVTGTLYSKNVPAPKQGGRVIVSKNGHTIKMSDPSDGMDLLAGLFPGVKFLQGYGLLDDYKVDMAGETAKMLGGIELTDQLGFYNIKMSSHNRSISISSPLGNVSIDALTGISIEAPNGDISITGKNIDITAYNKITLNSGKNVKLAQDKHRAGWLSTGFDAEAAGKNIGKALTKFLGVGKLFDLSLIRTLLEIFIRPIDGTLDIKSGRFLLLQAGNQTASGDTADYNVKVTDKLYGFFIGDSPEKKEVMVFQEMRRYLRQSLRQWCVEFVQKFDSYISEWNNVKWLFPDSGNAFMTNPDNPDDLLHNLFGKTLDNYDNYKSTITFSPSLPNATQIFVVDNWLKDLLKAGLELKSHLDKLDYVHLFGKMADGSYVSNQELQGMAAELFSSLLVPQDVNTLLWLDNPVVPAPAAPAPSAAPVLLAPAHVPAPGFTTASNGAPAAGLFSSKVKLVKEYIGDNTKKTGSALFRSKIKTVDEQWLQAISRRLMSMVIERIRSTNPFKTFLIPAAKYEPVGGVETAPANMDHPFSDADWIKYVNEIKRIPPPSSGFSKFVSGAWDSIKDAGWKLVPFESDTWSSEKSGQVLFAESKGTTFYFNHNGATVSRLNDATARELQEDLKKI